MSKTYKSEALAAVHEMMEGFYESGAIDKKTMREFDEGCLTTVEPLTPEEIRTAARLDRTHLTGIAAIRGSTGG